jgi:hypothetical protein
VGGLIVRNSWSDGLGLAHGSVGRGSHSAAYYMHAVSDHDEGLVCPNQHSPRSWWACKTLQECISPVSIAYAEAARRPIKLRCLDNGAAVKPGVVCAPSGVYYLANVTEWDSDGLFVACFLRDTRGSDGVQFRLTETSLPQGDVCMPPLVMDDLASIFTPLKISHENDPLVCGFNFLPYETISVMASRYSITEHVAATDYNIE